MLGQRRVRLFVMILVVLIILSGGYLIFNKQSKSYKSVDKFVISDQDKSSISSNSSEYITEESASESSSSEVLSSTESDNNSSTDSSEEVTQSFSTVEDTAKNFIIKGLNYDGESSISYVSKIADDSVIEKLKSEMSQHEKLVITDVKLNDKWNLNSQQGYVFFYMVDDGTNKKQANALITATMDSNGVTKINSYEWSYNE